LADWRLRRLVQYAFARNTFYRERWRAAGFELREFRGAADLALLPAVSKSEIIDAGDAARDPLLARQALLEMRTSGTSGRGIHIVRRAREERVMRRAILRHFIQIGMRPWHRTLTFASAWLASRQGRIVRAITRSQHVEPQAPLDEQIAALRSFRPLAIVGQTGGIYLLARELLRCGTPFPVRWVVPTGATLMPEMRRALQDGFGGARVCDMYGAIEVGPIAWQCRRGGYHLDADRVVVEIVDEQERPAPPGRSGQVIVTVLQSWTMPFIRYRLQDIASLSTGVCDCGCTFPLLGPVQGRVNDFLPTPRGELVSPHFFFHLFDGLPRNPIKEWRVVQESAERLVYEYIPESYFEAGALESGLRLVRERFGNGCVVEARRVDVLPMTPSGKRRCIISKLRPSATRLEEVWIRPSEDGRAEGR
jgi:phenylacetate-CoA ligase